MTQDGEPRDPDADRDLDPMHPSALPTIGDEAGAEGGAPALSPGEVLAERFRILRFVARGGMGELYEAEDLELHERVALKTILPEVVGRAHVRDRFLREVQLARKVTHPNVCRTYDVFHHREADRDLVFVTMEFLEGETLADHLRRAKQLPTSEALSIARQVAAALTAAHEAGVIHRDLKAGNVLLVPSSEPTGKARAVVTDFGLAVPARETLGSDSLTATGHFVGTPSYMAPEQVEGAPITPATDVYAFGILLYEMMTGSLPFEGGSPLAVAARRLKNDAPSPRAIRPDLDPLWEAVIVRCMKRNPDERFASVAEAASVLTGEIAPPTTRSDRRVLAAWVLGAAAVAAILVAMFFFRFGSRGPSLPGGTGGNRPSVAVLGFRNLSGRPDAAWLSTAFSEMLTTELGAGGKLRTIPGERVARMKVDLSLHDADSYAHDTLARVRSNLGSDAVVFGSFLAVGAGTERKIRLDLRVQEASAQEAVQVASVEGFEAELLDLVARAGAKLRESLAAGEVSSAELSGARAAFPGNSEAARLYAEGISKLRLFDALAARDALTDAVAADPKNALVHSALSSAWAALGYDKTAAEEAEKALALSEGLPRESKLTIEGRLHEASRNWAKAIETYRTLYGFYPDNLEYGLKLAADQIAADEHPAAMETITALRALPKPSSEDPRIDLLEARIEDSRGDFRRALQASDKAVGKANALGARQLAAEALSRKWNALVHLGRPEEAWQAAVQAKEISAAAGNRLGVAAAIAMQANSRRNDGDLRGAEELFRQALAIDREIGNQAAISNDLNFLGNVLADQRDYTGAKKAYEQALAIRREIRSLRGVAGSLGNIANLLQYEGDLEGSRRMHDESLEIHRQLGDERGVAIEINNIAILLTLQGRLPEAGARFEEALKIKRGLGHTSSVAYTLTSLGELQTYQGDLAGAKRSLEEALRIREKLGEESTAIETRIDLLQVSLEEGGVDEAVRAGTEVADALVKAKDRPREGIARTLLALILLAKRDLAAAKREIDAAATLLADTDDAGAKLPMTIAAVRIGAAIEPRGFSALRREIDRAVADADRSGVVPLQLEARLARVELLEASGAREAARTEARGIEERARKLGFRLAAARAARHLVRAETRGAYSAIPAFKSACSNRWNRCSPASRRTESLPAT